MRWIYLLIGCCFLASMASGQPATDSLFLLKDYEKIPYISRLLRQSFKDVNEKTALAYYDALQDIAFKKDDATMQIAALAFLAQYYTLSNNLSKAQQYYEEGLELSHLRRLKYLEPVMLHLAGNNAYKQDRYASGLEKLLRAHTLMENLGNQYFPDMGQYLYDLAYAYFYYYEDLVEALRFTQAAMNYPMPSTETDIGCYNILGLIYRATGEAKLSDSCFTVALQKAEAANDTASIGDVSGNIGYNYMQAGRLDEAETYMQKDYHLSMLKQNWASACLSKMTLSSIALARNNTTASMGFIWDARELVRIHQAQLTRKALYTIYYFLYMNLSKTARLQGNDKALIGILDSMILYKDSLFRSRESREKASVQIKLIKESNQYQLELLRSEERRNILFRNTLIIIILLVTIVALQIVHRLKRVNKSNEEQLTEYANMMVEKNQLLEQFSNKMQELENQPGHIEHEIEDIFSALRTQPILSEEDWLNFKQLFERIYKNFFTNITQHIPGITQSEIRLLALTKLGLSTKEMADLQGVAADSIRKARYRLRKKIELHVHENKNIAQVLNEL